VRQVQLSPLIRTAIFVTDLERSCAFYESVLGLQQVFWEGKVAGSGLEKLLALQPGGSARARIYTADGSTVGMVGLFELSPPPAGQPVSRDGGIRPGQTCLVFYCTDLDEVLRRLEAMDHAVICPPTSLDVPGRVPQREMSFSDPDGVLVNLIEWRADDPHKPPVHGSGSKPSSAGRAAPD
jgi:catechol 2,3-dioxygenase-like lactoylglutathione lyase family enzyme